MITDVLTGYDAAQANDDLHAQLVDEIGKLTELVLESARSNVRYYPEVRSHLQQHLAVVANELISGEVTADFWQAWLEQYGKGSLMANSSQNPGLILYMNSEYWNSYRNRGNRIVVSRRSGRYKALDGTIKISYAEKPGVDLEELAARGDIDKRYLPTPPSFFMRIALQSNKNRILEGISSVLENFPYQNYFMR